MNQKLSDWASIAEIVSGVAVLVTLIFLILSIEENTAITRVSVYDQNMDSLNEWRALQISEGLSADWQAFMDDGRVPERLADVQTLNIMLFAIYEKSYFAYRYGVMGPSEWERFKTQICLRNSQVERIIGFSTRDDDPRGNTFTAEFLDYIHEECK